MVFQTRVVLIKRELWSQPQIHSDYFCSTFIGEERGYKFVGHSFYDRNNIYGGVWHKWIKVWLGIKREKQLAGLGHAQKIPELLLAEIFHSADLGAPFPTAAWWCHQGGIVPVILLENGVTCLRSPGSHCLSQDLNQSLSISQGIILSPFLFSWWSHTEEWEMEFFMRQQYKITGPHKLGF